MKSNKQILAVLNGCLKDQLTSINQFFLHARMTKDWGLENFNQHEFKCSIKAMKMADKLIERILFLESLPNLQSLGKLVIGENVPEILSGDLKILGDIHATLQLAIKTSDKDADYITREILKHLLEASEEHIDWIETQQWLVRNTGLENYLQSQSGGV